MTAVDPMLGHTVGGWTLVGLVGAGGMGTVYRAVNGGQEAALKMVRPALLVDPEFRRRFRREVDVMRRVRSGRMARVLDADPDAALPWVATELVVGPTLVSYIEAHGPLEEPRLVEFAEGLARAVDDLHQSDVVHRDIKPDNVMLTDWAPILVDFGIAKSFDSTTMTMPGIAFGSVAWMAPEQLMAERVSPAVDVWGWAVTTAYAATGRRPFGGPGANGEGLPGRILGDLPNLVGVPASLAGLLADAFAKDPEERPTPIELVYRLRKLVEEAKRALPRAHVLPGPRTAPAAPPSLAFQAGRDGASGSL